MPGMSFSSVRKYRFKRNRLFLGLSALLRFSVGASSETHAITIAGSSSGKGTSVIIPNIIKWKHNLLVIDPKGDNATKTTQIKIKQGYSVHVLDPFRISTIPTSAKAQFNPLSLIDVNSANAADEINVIAEALVMRDKDPGAANWDDGAQMLIAGVIAAIILDEDDRNRNLNEVRAFIRDDDALEAFAKQYKNDTRLGGIISNGASRAIKKEGTYYVSNAQRQTAWLDSNPVKAMVESSSFDLSDLKNKKRTAVYVVLPINYVETHACLLRLMVLTATSEMLRMTKSGNEKGEKCLFMLDEFYSLGFLKRLVECVGYARSLGLHLWPFLQNVGQLTELYGREGAETFFGNSGFWQFFGNKDPQTCEFISNSIGDRHSSGLFDVDKEIVGKPLMTPQEVKEHVKKRAENKEARRMIVFTEGKDVLSLRLFPYFKSFRWWL